MEPTPDKGIATASPENPPANFEKQAEAACQWFLGGEKFCDKIKKNVRCDGNVRNCPF